MRGFDSCYPCFMRFVPSRPNFTFVKKNNLLTDINLYLDGHQPSAHYKPARTDSQRRLTPQLRTQLIRTKHQVKRTQNRLFLSKYRRLQFTRQAQRRVLAGSTARLISPYRRFFKRGEWALPRDEHTADLDIPFSVSPEVAWGGGLSLTSFWDKAYPHILKVKGPRYSNILVTRMKWYGIKSTNRVKFRYTTLEKSFRPKKDLFSTRTGLDQLDEDGALLVTWTSAVSKRVLTQAKTRSLFALILRTTSSPSDQGRSSFWYPHSPKSDVYGYLVKNLYSTLSKSSKDLLDLYSVLTSMVRSTQARDSLLEVGNFFNANRQLVGDRFLAADTFTKSSGFFPRSLRGWHVSKRRPRRKKNFYRFRILSQVSHRVNHSVSHNREGLYKRTSAIFHTYYSFISMSRIQGQARVKRPLFSHFFNPQQLANRSLITISNDRHSLPLRQLRVGDASALYAKFSGALNMWDYQANDNFLETIVDNHLVQGMVKNPNGAGPSFMLGLFANVPQSPYANTNLDFDSTIGGSSSVSHTAQPWSLGTVNPLAVFMQPSGKLNLAQNALLFKYLFWNSLTIRPSSHLFTSNALIQAATLNLCRYGFADRSLLLTKTNLWPLQLFRYNIRRKVVKVVVNTRYLPRTTSYFYKTLVSFMEYYTGKKVYLKFNAFVENALTYSDLARCYMWFNRVLGFQRILGHRIFVHESLRIFHVAIRFRDPTFLSNWIKAMLYRMSFWKYRVLFRYIKYVLRMLFWSQFDDLDFKGVKLALRGKISVAGNARARSLLFSVGETSHSEMNHRVLSHFTTVHSFTGVMGFRLTFYF